MDGYFGPMTESAVRDWQRKNGLAVDGIVGPNTWASLCTDGNNSNGLLPTCNTYKPFPLSKNCYGFTDRARFVMDAIDECFGKGTYYCRDWTSDKSTSEHIGGNAMDCRVGPGYHNSGRYYRGDDKEELDTLYDWIKENSGDLKIDNVIWYGKNWSRQNPYDRTCCGGSNSATYSQLVHLHFIVLGPYGNC